MFRPTQTTPIALTAFNTLVGIILTVALIVMSLINAFDKRILTDLGVNTADDSGLIFLTAVCVLIAAIRPLAGGAVLLVFGILIVSSLPIIGTVAIVFALLSLLRAWLSRRYLASQQ